MKEIIAEINKEKKLVEEYKENIKVMEDIIQHYYHQLEEKVTVEDLRPAQSTDIIVGQIIFLDGDDGWYCSAIEEVLYPNDMYKGYYLENSGSRYGLQYSYVLKDEES